jgi:glutaredoxin
MHRALLTCALLGAGVPLAAQTDFTDLSAAERAAFRAELRALLLDEPEIVARALAGPSPYADAVESDLSLIDTHAAQLFPANEPLAILVRSNCPDCIAALDELRTLTDEIQIKFSIINLDDNPGLAAALQIDTVPSYVMSDKMVRGHVPSIVLRRYLTD